MNKNWTLNEIWSIITLILISGIVLYVLRGIIPMLILAGSGLYLWVKHHQDRIEREKINQIQQTQQELFYAHNYVLRELKKLSLLPFDALYVEKLDKERSIQLQFDVNESNKGTHWRYNLTLPTIKIEKYLEQDSKWMTFKAQKLFSYWMDENNVTLPYQVSKVALERQNETESQFIFCISHLKFFEGNGGKSKIYTKEDFHGEDLDF